MKSTENNKHPQGSIWLARIYFIEILECKVRPVVIVNNESLFDDIDTIVAPVTSRPSRNEFDVLLNFWKEAGLELPSVVRSSKITTISKSSLIRKLGNLQPEDLKRVLIMCRQLF